MLSEALQQNAKHEARLSIPVALLIVSQRDVSTSLDMTIRLTPVNYEVFARKYRPQTFDDLVGQTHVSRTLKNAVAQNRLAHAYLLLARAALAKLRRHEFWQSRSTASKAQQLRHAACVTTAARSLAATVST